MAVNETQSWRKLGCIFSPPLISPWMITHASNPVVERLEQDNYRVYFGCRDSEKRGSIGSFEFDLKKPDVIRNISALPILSHGDAGTFDDSGISMGCLQTLEDGTRYLYYVGWNLTVAKPWRNSIGLAVARPGSEQFVKYSVAPILDCCDVDEYSIAYPWVVRNSDTDWLMYYVSKTSGGQDGKTMVYPIKVATSADGIGWQRSGKIVLDVDYSSNQLALSRPCVVQKEGRYYMWYSYGQEGDIYRIGCADSADGFDWERRGELAGLKLSEEGFDSRMVCYPCVFEHKDKTYMLYNGNYFGWSGIGLAVLV